MNIDYNEYVDRMIVEIADRQTGEFITSKNLRLIHEERFPNCPPTWFQSLATELHRRGLGVDWQDTNNEVFLPNGQLFSKAADIRKRDEAIEKTTHFVAIPSALPWWRNWQAEVNWSKWGTIFGGLSLLAFLIVEAF